MMVTTKKHFKYWSQSNNITTEDLRCH